MLSEAALQAVLPRLQALLEVDDVVAADLFQELADVGVRSGLGQYFTPAPAARAIAAFLKPKSGEHWLDPFCGSGLLLGEVALANPGVRLYGTDLDPRLLRLAATEARLRHPRTHLSLERISALSAREAVLDAVGAPDSGVNGIVTNPPFGAIDLQGAGMDGAFYLAAHGVNAIEVLGLEQALRLLAPGGRLGIVLPQSVLSNKRSDVVREYVAEVADILGILSLPPETFGMFKGVGKASVLFAMKRAAVRRRPSRIAFGLASSIGWDGTGRVTHPEDVLDTALSMRDGREVAGRVGSRTHVDVSRNLTAEWNLREKVDGYRLGDLAEAIFTGKSPARGAYVPGQSDGAVRVLKVGDLTGAGVDWSVRERSFATIRQLPDERCIRVGDIVLTAAAHHPRYIGAKVDYIDQVPADTCCIASGEVMVIRCSSGTDGRVITLWLRSPEGRAAIQACITGQTAHLHPDYVADVIVPRGIVEGDFAAVGEQLAEALRRRRAFEVAADAAYSAFLQATKQPEAA